MKANADPVVALFEKKLILEVPLFQRQYVWTQEQQWQPLWEDLSRKFSERLEGRTDGPVHFLGAMVLDQKQTPTTHVEKRQVIDGQQRLTTLQIFLAAFRDFCAENRFAELAAECESYTLNKGMMARPDVDRFKVWPTLADREQFADVMTSGSLQALEAKHPLVRRPYARRPERRPRMVEAYLYFYSELREYFIGTEDEKPIAADRLLSERLEESFTALRSSLQVVVIDLDKDDDAQVIFETLNARGEPLLPADLLRNFIFLRAGRFGEDQEELYERYWRRFDAPFWREEVRQGRLSRPRSDLFMQHFLASRQTVDIPAKHLFVEYKYWIEKAKPFQSVRDELEMLSRQGEHFRRILDPQPNDVVSPLATFLYRFDMSTSYPLLLHLFDADIDDQEWRDISITLESYLLRRAVCGLTAKNYNRLFLNLTRSVRREGTSLDGIRRYLAELGGDSSEWPNDDIFHKSWREQHIYRLMGNAKIVHILRRLSDAFLGPMNERITVDGPLTVEHILPQDWENEWPLSDGSKGLSYMEMWSADPADPRLEPTRRRNAMLQTIGNLTIITRPLNSSVSNGSWTSKKPALLEGSLLPINQQLHNIANWDEAAIENRSDALFERALQIWPGPPR